MEYGYNAGRGSELGEETSRRAYDACFLDWETHAAVYEQNPGPKRLARQARAFFGDNRGNVSAPFIWNMTRACMAIGQGFFRHFPAGTYYQQVSTPWGEIEIDLMRQMERSWIIFAYKDLDKYDADDLKFIGWMEADNRVKRTNETIAQIWNYDLGQHGKLYPQLSN